MTESTDSGSPATSRTTSAPPRASAASVLATSPGSPSAGRMSGTAGNSGLTVSSVMPGSGELSCGGSGRLVPTSASTSAGTSGSVNTSSAQASTLRARPVNRPGSPGPEPTNTTRPGFVLRPRVIPIRSHQLPGAQVEQLGGDGATQLRCLPGLSDAGRTDHVGSVHRRHAAAQ